MRRLAIALGLSLALLAAATAPAAETLTGQVVSAHDGDTCKVRLVDGQTLTVRLWGIDAPERDQPWGDVAAAYLSRLVGQAVGLEVRSRDRYCRQVAVIVHQGQAVNLALLQEGLAWWYRRYAWHSSEYRDAEAAAQAARRGLWADQEPIPPWEWRKGSRPTAPPTR